MKYLYMALLVFTMHICPASTNTHAISIETLFPTSPSACVLDTCMQVCSDLVQLDPLQAERPGFCVDMDALLGKMVRLQVGIERLAGEVDRIRLHADDLVYLLAMINRVEMAFESAPCNQEYKVLYQTLVRTIKTSLARLLHTVYQSPNSI